ncbi:MAG: CHASE2 domain-containing protein, partial [Firmicutes bacterium]|nr:CHASE2 domain-containing protein [Bacillota bacterium]
MKNGRRFRFILEFLLPLAVALLLTAGGLLRPLDRGWYDTLARLAAAREEKKMDTPVIVAIDAAALRRYGRWPWPRSRIASLLAKIAAGRPRAVGFDILFSDPAEGEAALEAAMRRVSVVLASRLDLRRLGGVLASGEPDLPRPAFARAAAACGFIDFFPDPDGVVRRMLVKLRHGPIRLSFAAALAEAAGELPPGTPDEILLSPAHLRPGETVGAVRVLAGEVDPA